MRGRTVTKKSGERLNMNVRADKTPVMLKVKRVKRVRRLIVKLGVVEARNGQGDWEERGAAPMKYGSVIMVVFRKSSIRYWMIKSRRPVSWSLRSVGLGMFVVFEEAVEAVLRGFSLP